MINYKVFIFELFLTEIEIKHSDNLYYITFNSGIVILIYLFILLMIKLTNVVFILK